MGDRQTCGRPLSRNRRPWSQCRVREHGRDCAAQRRRSGIGDDEQRRLDATIAVVAGAPSVLIFGSHAHGMGRLAILAAKVHWPWSTSTTATKRLAGGAFTRPVAQAVRTCCPAGTEPDAGNSPCRSSLRDRGLFRRRHPARISSTEPGSTSTYGPPETPSPELFPAKPPEPIIVKREDCRLYAARRPRVEGHRSRHRKRAPRRDTRSDAMTRRPASLRTRFSPARGIRRVPRRVPSACHTLKPATMRREGDILELASPSPSSQLVFLALEWLWSKRRVRHRERLLVISHAT